jgi:hypothetical protein
MPQFEIGQRELVDVHHFTLLLDIYALTEVDPSLKLIVRSVNEHLLEHVLFSTQKTTNYEKIVSIDQLKKSKKEFKSFVDAFMTAAFFDKYVGLGFAEINLKEKDVNSLTQTVFYSTDLMKVQRNRQSYEFEKECINQMARSNLHKTQSRFPTDQDLSPKYKVVIPIGYGFTYTKYNTFLHFLNVVQDYWNNPDLSNIQVFGKDIRALLAVSCQKIVFDEKHCGWFHYGPFETSTSSTYRMLLDLAVATSIGHVIPTVSQRKRNDNRLLITDRVFEYNYVRRILLTLFEKAQGVRFKSDNEVLNLCLLSLMLDFGLYERYAGLLNLPFMKELQHADTQELQVEVASMTYEFDKKNLSDSITRSRVEDLIFEVSYKFLVNKDFPVVSKQFRMIRLLNADPDYQSYVLLCKIYMSLCQINRSVEVDYYKVHCDGEFRIIIPRNYSKSTSDYLDEITRRYTFSVHDGYMIYDDLPVFDLRPQQPEINLHRVRFYSATEIQSMVKYIEITNAFNVVESNEQYLIFMSDNVLLIDVSDNSTTIRINKMAVEVATIFFNESISFVPCFKYAESEDVVLFTSRNIHYLVDKGGQFCSE